MEDGCMAMQPSLLAIQRRRPPSISIMRPLR